MVRLPSTRVNDLRGRTSNVSPVHRSFQQTSVVALSGLLAADSLPAASTAVTVIVDGPGWFAYAAAQITE